MDVAVRQRYMSDCKEGSESCDRSKLTASQISEVLAAEHDRNLWNCVNGWEQCDHSRLTPREAAQIAVSEHRRNILACTGGEQTCDYSAYNGGGQDSGNRGAQTQLQRLSARFRILRSFSALCRGDGSYPAQADRVPMKVRIKSKYMGEP